MSSMSCRETETTPTLLNQPLHMQRAWHAAETGETDVGWSQAFRGAIQHDSNRLSLHSALLLRIPNIGVASPSRCALMRL